MSLLSRLFRKAPSPPPVPASTPHPASSAKAGHAVAKRDEADRALAAAAEEAALQAAIQGRDGQAIARLVVAGTSTKIRQSAARAIDDPEMLRKLIRDTRGGNDKGVYKILTSRRDLLLEQGRKLEQVRAEIDAASRELELHSQRAFDAAYGETLDRCERRWALVADQADPDLRDRAQRSIDHARETVAEHLRQMAAQAEQDQAAAQVAEEVRRLREQEAQATAAVAAEQARMLDDQRRAEAENQKVEQQAVRQIGDLIRRARAALSDGSTRRAAAARRTIDEKLAGAPPLPAKLASQLQQLDLQLDELKDWKSFSVTPKRAELIEDMESLVGAQMDPLTLHDRIKSLQDEWRALGSGAGGHLEADGQRFHDAAQKASQPCREYFAAQALVREENLLRRDALLASLVAFEAQQDWEQADWRTVISVMRETKLEWHRCSPVDRLASRAQSEKFAALSASLQGRLDAEYARNIQQKEWLIERARALLASEDGRKAIDAAKELQQKWRNVGPVPREVDQRLWGDFRQHCDAVFQRRQQDVAAYSAALESNKVQAIALCEELEKIAALEGAELLARAGARADLRNAFEALGEFPRADTVELRKRLDRAVERCDKAIARQHARDAERGWDDLFEAANHVRAYRLAVARDSDTPVLASLKDAAETFIASVQRWPKGGLTALRQAVAGERSADLAANELALRMLCVRAELLTDGPTPPEDQDLRRDYQLQRLVQNMGQGLRTDAVQMDTLAIEWVGVGPVDDAAYAPLIQRFRRCREHGNARAPKG